MEYKSAKNARCGCIHIYTGDGKGKTTAAVGLAVRFAGNGGRVLFSQFLKDGSSSEIRVLKQIPGITVSSFTENLGFSFRMSEEEKQHARDCWSDYLNQVLTEAIEQKAGLLVLDEILAAYRLEFVDRERLLTFLRERPENLEVVLTGRDPAPELAELADYISDIRNVRHPFDDGIAARAGIEY